VARLLIVHHTPSPSMQAMFEAVVAGATTDEIENVEVIRRPALAATVPDALAADGYILGTPANLGMMSGALKVFYVVKLHTSAEPLTWVNAVIGDKTAARDLTLPERCGVATCTPFVCDVGHAFGLNNVRWSEARSALTLVGIR
jgi:hypothetical protein